MTEHFINFMQNDNLGRIATLHKILADKVVGGTFNESCIKVAEMHSDAVDFSKTGIPVCSSKWRRVSCLRSILTDYEIGSI